MTAPLEPVVRRSVMFLSSGNVAYRHGNLAVELTWAKVRELVEIYQDDSAERGRPRADAAKKIMLDLGYPASHMEALFSRPPKVSERRRAALVARYCRQIYGWRLRYQAICPHCGFHGSDGRGRMLGHDEPMKPAPDFERWVAENSDPGGYITITRCPGSYMELP